MYGPGEFPVQATKKIHRSVNGGDNCLSSHSTARVESSCDEVPVLKFPRCRKPHACGTKNREHADCIGYFFKKTYGIVTKLRGSSHDPSRNFGSQR